MFGYQLLSCLSVLPVHKDHSVLRGLDFCHRVSHARLYSGNEAVTNKYQLETLRAFIALFGFGRNTHWQHFPMVVVFPRALTQAERRMFWLKLQDLVFATVLFNPPEFLDFERVVLDDDGDEVDVAEEQQELFLSACLELGRSPDEDFCESSQPAAYSQVFEFTLSCGPHCVECPGYSSYPYGTQPW